VGGGFITNPLLNAVLGVPMHTVAGSSLCQISGTSLAGLLRHRRHGQFDAWVTVIILGGVFAGTEVGVRLVGWLKGLGAVRLAGGVYTVADVVLLSVFLSLLLGIGVSVFVESLRAARSVAAQADQGAPKKRRGFLARVRLPPYVTPVGGEPVSVILVAYSGVLIGVAQGLLGIGGGVLMLPMLIYFIGVGTHAAVGTDLLVVFAGSLWGTLRHAMHGNVSLPLVLALMVTATFGSQLGAVTTTKLAGHRLRRYFSLVVAVAALVLAWKLGNMFGWWPTNSRR
jgi:hypothetical protein